MTQKKLYLVFTTVAALKEKPEDNDKVGRRDSQLVFGEGFMVEKEENGWLYGTSEVDGYKGYIKKSELKEAGSPPTHFTDIPWTHIYPEPSFKTVPVMGLTMLSRLEVDESQEKDGFVRVPDLGWIFKEHVRTLGEMNRIDHVDTAMKYLDTPYIYGGRSSQGIDCSGLTQMALMRAGQKCPRDSDQQQDVIGTEVTDGSFQRGDIVYFPGHVGIMVDEKNMINATARKMKVAIEPLETVKKANKDTILAVRRPS